MADTMTQHDYYEILQVHPKASLAVIKKAYRTLLLELGNHPDRGGDSETAALITEAFHVLSDPERRAAYDRTYFAEPAEPKGAETRAGEARASTPKAPPQDPNPATAGTSLIVLCPRCRTKNRVRSQDLLAVAKCSRCGQALSQLPNPLADLVQPLIGWWHKAASTLHDLRDKPTRPPGRPGTRRMSLLAGVVLPIALMAASVAAAGYALSDLWLGPADPVEAAGKLTKEGKLDMAAESLHRGLYHDPKNPRLYGLLGDVYEKQGNLPKALENYLAAAQLSPEDSLYWALQGNIYHRLKDTAHAEYAFNRALRADPHCAVALVGLGNIAAKNKDLKRAQKFYQDALHESPNADVLYNLGLVYEWDHRPEDAVKAYTQALIIDPDHRSSMVSLAALYYTQHQYDLAVPQYIKASHIKDADLDLHEKLADCFEHIGRRQEAIHEWSVCLEQAKNNPNAVERARRALDRLRPPPSG